MPEPLDPEAVRPRFPALARGAVHLDGPGGSQAPEEVIAAMAEHLRGGTSNMGGVYPTSLAVVELVAQARESAAELTGSEPDEIAFGPNMTTLNFLLAHAVARTLQPGDEIVVTELDHDANIAPWLRVADDHGLVVRTAPVRPDATLDVDGLEALGVQVFAVRQPEPVGLGDAVARAEGEVFALRDVCSHAEVPLSEGEIYDTTVECWLHGSCFDLRTGQPTGLPATEPVPVYPVKIEGDDVYVAVEKES